MNTYISGSNQTTEQETSRLKQTYNLCDEDLAAIKTLGQSLQDRFNEIIEEFYVWLETQPSWQIFHDSEEKIQRLKDAQQQYWQGCFEGHIDGAYIDTRKIIGKIHAQVGLPLGAYFSAMAKFQDLFIKRLPDITPTQTMALNRMLMLDAGITVETFNAENNKTIAEQNKAMMEMSTPVTAIWDNILLLPIVGIIDSVRAQDIMDTMLTRIAELQTQVFILDISGVAVVDTAVANHIIKMTKASELMGCTCVMSGISPLIAQTMVELGINTGKLKTTSNLNDALKYAFQLTKVSFNASDMVNI